MKDPLFGNKLAAALLIVLLLAVGLPVIVNTFAELREHVAHHDAEGPIAELPGVVYFPGELEIKTAEAAEAEVDLGTLLAAADVERGARAAAICSSCHSFDRGGPNGAGPNLWEVVNREVASVPGYAYSQALRNFGGVWSYERLDPYLENSAAYIDGTQMAQRIRKDQKRADILAYLGSLSDNPVPFPAPAAAEGEGPVEVVEEGDTPMGEAGEAAADTIDFEAAQPGEATVDPSQRNQRGDDGYPGDPAKTGSNYRSSDEDGVNAEPSDAATETGLPDEDAARESAQPSAPDEPSGSDR